MLRRGDLLPLDEMTRRNLELVEPLRADPPGHPGAAGTTLLGVLDRTMTPMGARLLRAWLLAPLVDPAAITARLDAVERSEEHTSELQSRLHLVCRLLLEKKKKKERKSDHI